MNNTKKTFLAALGLTAAMLTSAMAADINGGSMKDPLPEPEYTMDYGAGWMIRARILGVMPSEDSSDWKLDGLAYSSADLSIDNSVVPELDISYFFNKNIAVELVLGVTPHDIKGKADLDGVDIGNAWLLPPTLLLQYHFDAGRGIKPYVGAGVNYTVFFNEDAGTPGVVNSLDLDNSFGWALQAGVDIHLEGNWFLNVDVKKLWLNTDATVQTTLGRFDTNVDIDPWMIGVGIGYRFGGVVEPLK